VHYIPGYDGEVNTTGGHAADIDAAFPNGDTYHPHNSLKNVGLHVSVGCSHLLHTNGYSGRSLLYDRIPAESMPIGSVPNRSVDGRAVLSFLTWLEKLVLPVKCLLLLIQSHILHELHYAGLQRGKRTCTKH